MSQEGRVRNEANTIGEAASEQLSDESFRVATEFSDDDFELPALDADDTDSFTSSFLQDSAESVSTSFLDVERIISERKRAEAADETIRNMRRVSIDVRGCLTPV